MTLLARHLFGQYVWVACATLAVGMPMLVGSALLFHVDGLGAIPPGSLISIAWVVALRSLIAITPAAVLIAVATVGLGSRRRGERVALEACGVRTQDRLFLALAFGLSAGLVVAEASRSLIPRLRSAERDLRVLLALLAAEDPITALGTELGEESWLGGCDEAGGGRFSGVLVRPGGARANGLELAWAREGRVELDGASGRLRLSLEGVQLLRGQGGSARAERLALDWEVGERPGGPARRYAALDELWASRRSGRPWSSGRVDAELSRRVGEALLPVFLALLGFVLGERAPRREPLAWAWIVVALLLDRLLQGACRELARTIPEGLAPWIAHLGLLGLALAVWCGSASSET